MPVRGGNRLRQVIANQKKPPEVQGVAVGFFSSAKYPDGTPVTNVAAWNEYGTNASSERPFDVPARPFMRPTVAEEKDNVRQLLRQVVDPETMTVTRRDADLLGAYVAGRIQAKITSIRTPPNSPRTTQKKGSSNPLLDTAFMRSAVTWETL